MSSSAACFSHRRRSHSASSPIPRRQPDDVKWRISAKRSRPSSIRSPSYKDLAHDQPAEKWDVDLWRRGKRARRNSNVSIALPARSSITCMLTQPAVPPQRITDGRVLRRRQLQYEPGPLECNLPHTASVARIILISMPPSMHLCRVPVLPAEAEAPQACFRPRARPSISGSIAAR